MRLDDRPLRSFWIVGHLGRLLCWWIPCFGESVDLFHSGEQEGSAIIVGYFLSVFPVRLILPFWYGLQQDVLLPLPASLSFPASLSIARLLIVLAVDDDFPPIARWTPITDRLSSSAVSWLPFACPITGYPSVQSVVLPDWPLWHSFHAVVPKMPYSHCAESLMLHSGRWLRSYNVLPIRIALKIPYSFVTVCSIDHAPALHFDYFAHFPLFLSV
jgi:hypothetical protein